MSQVRLEWRGSFENHQVNSLHSEAFGHALSTDDRWTQVNDHSLGWVTAHDRERLVGFINVAWDGAVHAFVLDTIVRLDSRRLGIGTGLVAMAAEHARAAGCEWLHVDFDEDLREFYFEACGFRPTDGGLIQL